jgi:hypothetical protein
MAYPSSSRDAYCDRKAVDLFGRRIYLFGFLTFIRFSLVDFLHRLFPDRFEDLRAWRFCVNGSACDHRLLRKKTAVRHWE